MVASIMDKPKMTETKPMEIDVSVSKKKSYCRVISFAVVAVSTIAIAAVLGASYFGHVITRSAYREAHLYFKDDDGKLVDEEVSIGEKQVTFNTSGQFVVVYDYEHMLVIIRTYDEEETGDCYVTSLTPAMGSMNDIVRGVDKAMSSDGLLPINRKRIEFRPSNATVDGLVLNTEAKQLCGDLPLIMLEKTDGRTDNVVSSDGIVKRGVRRGGRRNNRQGQRRRRRCRRRRGGVIVIIIIIAWSC